MEVTEVFCALGGGGFVAVRALDRRDQLQPTGEVQPPAVAVADPPLDRLGAALELHGHLEPGHRLMFPSVTAPCIVELTEDFPARRLASKGVLETEEVGDMSARTAVPWDGGLIERAHELTRIEVLLRAALVGDGAALLIEGAPGIGKTSLLGAARGVAGRSGMRVVAAVAGPLEREVDFAVARQLLARAVAEARADLLTGVARLAAAPLGVADGSEPPASLGAALHGLYWACANLADQTPLAIIVDDLQWADEPSLRFLSYLARRVGEHPMLLCVASRPAGDANQGQVLAAAAGDWDEVLRLAPLSETGAAQLISCSFSTDPEPEFCRACVHATGGNPFLLVEAVASLRADGVAPSAADAGRVEHLRPETITRAILARIGRLGPEASQVASAIAVLGSARTHRIAQLAELAPTTVAVAIEDLRREGIVADDVAVGFAHPLIGQAIDADLSAAARGLAHLRAARLLDTEGEGSAVVSPHLLVAEPSGDPWVVETLQAAARAATARGANEPAVALLCRALAEPPPQALRPALLHELGRALARAGSLEDAVDAFSDSLERTRESDQRAERALELGHTLALAGRVSDALRVLRDACGRLGDELDDRAIVLEAELALVAHMGLPAREWIGRLGAVVERVSGGSAAERSVRAFYAYAAAGALQRSAPEVEQLARSAVAPLGGVPAEPMTLQSAAAALALAGCFAEALAAMDRTLELARARGDETQFGLSSLTRTWIALRAGRVQEAEADARAALGTGPPEFQARHAAGNLILALIERGELDLADTVLAEQGLADTRERGAMTGAILFGARGRLNLVRGKPQHALADLRLCAEMLLAAGMVSSGFAGWRRDTALAQLALGNVDAAQRVADEDLELSRSFRAPREIGIALQTAGLIARGERGLELLAESAAVLERSEARLDHAHSLVEYGAALRRAGRRRQAREPLALGLDAASRCGARATAERARAELVAAGAKPRRERISGPEALTASELRVARLAAEGHGNREIAQALFVTRRTVEVHLTSVYRKLDIASREELPPALAPEHERA